MNRSWMRGLLGALKNTVPELRRLANRYRPRFEQLEDRWTPSAIFTVNTILDDPLGPTTPGQFTLRDAINAVNADAGNSAAHPDVIVFALSGGSAISLDTDLPAILGPVMIDGSTQGAGGVTVLGNGFTFLDVESAVSVKGMTFANGLSNVGAGGAFAGVGDLNLGDSAFVNNFGSVHVTGNVVAGPNVGISNYGSSTVGITGDLTMGDGGSVFNGANFDPSESATFVVGGDLRIGDNGFAYNVGTSSFQVGRDLTIGDGGFVFNGASDSDAASLTVGGSVSLGVSGGQSAYVRSFGTSSIHVSGNFTLEGNGSFVFNGQNATAAATFQVGGSFVLPGASDYVYNYGTSTFAIGSLRLGAQGNFYDYGSLSINGPSSTSSSAVRIFAGGSLDVAADAVFTIDSQGSIFADNGTSITVEGNLTIDFGAMVLADVLELSDAAIVDVFGTLDVNTQVIEGRGQVHSEAGSDVTSSLTIRIVPYAVTYNGVAHAATGTAIGAFGQDLSGLLDFSGTTHTNAGSYAHDTWTFLGNNMFAGVSGTIDDTIAKADQTITVTQAAPGTATYGASFLASATASSGLAVAIAAGGVGSGSGAGSASILMTSGTGTASVTFSQAGNNNYNAATVIVENVTAQKANQTITVTQAAPGTASNGATFPVAATASSGLAVSIATSGVLSGSGVGSATITVTGTSGSGTVTYSQAGDNNYNAATAVVQTTTVATASGAGITVVGNSLYVVGGLKSNDQIEITAVGKSNTGSTGVKVTATLDGKKVTMTYTQAFATIYVTGYDGNVSVNLASTLTISAVVHLGNGNDDVQLGNGANTVTLGNGNNHLKAGNGTNLVTIGSATSRNTNVVELGNGNRNAVTILGNGDNLVAVGNGDSNTVTIAGKGTHIVAVGNGSHNNVTLGDGPVLFFGGNGKDNVLHLGYGLHLGLAGRGWTVTHPAHPAKPSHHSHSHRGCGHR